MSETAVSPEPWQWEEAEWRRKVERVRAGRSLKPAHWKDGARFAVALSFDADHETLELRDGGRSARPLSQGQFGARVGMPRILQAARKAGGAGDVLHAGGVGADPSRGAARASSPRATRSASTAGFTSSTRPCPTRPNATWFRSREVLARSVRRASRSGCARRPGISARDPRIPREMGLHYDSSLMADSECYELLYDGAPSGIVELPVEWIRDDAVYFNMDRMSALRPYTPPEACSTSSAASSRRVRRRRPLPARRCIRTSSAIAPASSSSRRSSASRGRLAAPGSRPMPRSRATAPTPRACARAEVRRR